MKHRSRERATSPVVGVALLLVIVVLLGAVTATMTLGFDDRLVEPGPLVGASESVSVVLEGNETTHSLRIVHEAGRPVPADGLVVRVSSGGATSEQSFPTVPALDDGEWNPGEGVELDLNETTVCAGGGEEATVSLVYESNEGANLVSRSTVPIERGQFLVDGSVVRPTTEYTANVTFVGTAWSGPSLDPPVNVHVEVDESVVHSWTGVRDTTETVGTFDVSEQSAGTGLSVTAEGATATGYRVADPGETPDFEFSGTGYVYVWDYRTISSTENSTHVRTLRDGDAVPELDADDGQQSVDEYLQPYVENGTVSLQGNQAIYLFDFNTDDPVGSSSVEFQDAVVLVTFFTEETSVAVHRTTRGEDVVVCPSEF